MSDRPGMPASYDEDISREPGQPESGPCLACGCTLGDPWYCPDCTNPYCPCSDSEDDEEE